MGEVLYAFPRDDVRDADGCGIMEGSQGMTLRDYFAGQALPTMCARPLSRGLNTIQPGSPMHPGCAAAAAYAYADAMLAERAKALGQEGGAL